jgi:hypothetical protein
MRAALLSCFLASTPAIAQPAAAKAPLQGHVLVWQNAAFVLDPNEPTKTVQLAKLVGTRAANLGVAAPMRVVGTRGDLVEVEPSRDEHCAASHLVVGELVDVRLFVARHDLAPVVSKRFTTTSPDGTRIELLPGAPLGPTATSDTYAVTVGGEDVEVAIPAEHVGHAYRTAPPAEPETKDPREGTTLFHMRGGVTATLGGRPFTTTKDLFPAIARTVQRKGETVLFPLASRCARATVAVPASHLESSRQPGEVHGLGGLLGALEAASGDFVRAGTPMFVGKHRLGKLARNVRVAGLPCIDLAPYFSGSLTRRPGSQRTSTKLTACAPPGTKLVHVDSPFGTGGAFGASPPPKRR